MDNKRGTETRVQPIFYVPGIEMSSENEARKNIYKNKLFGKASNSENNQVALFNNIPTLEYSRTLYDDYGNRVRWVDFKLNVCGWHLSIMVQQYFRTF